MAKQENRFHLFFLIYFEPLSTTIQHSHNALDSSKLDKKRDIKETLKASYTAK